MSELYLTKPEILGKIPPDSHSVIEASAGTGKTYTIEHLFVELLLKPAVAIENILVLTFTEKAASELKARVRGILERALSLGTAKPPVGSYWRFGEAERIKLEQSLFSFDRAPIYTIHGFFQRVIVENAFNSGRLFEQTLVDGSSIFSEVFRKVLREEIARGPEKSRHLSFWLENLQSGVEKLEKLLFDCHKKRCEMRPLLDVAKLTKLAEKVGCLLSGEDALDGLKDACKSKKVNTSTVKALLKRMESLKTATASLHSDNDLLCFLLETEGIANSYNICEKIGLAKPCGGKSEELIDSVIELLDELPSPRAAIVQMFLGSVQERLEREKRQRGYYDFDDMILFLWEGLNSPQGNSLLKTLRARYRYALIDESQDTDEVQWKIFRKVFLESNGDNVIYLIGDPKQAIYGFRGADVYTYLSAKKDICEGKDSIPLLLNFRSTLNLIDAFNIIFDQKAVSPFFSGNITYDASLECGKKSFRAVDARGRDIVPVKLVRVSPWGEKLTTREFRVKMGRYIASEIKAILSDSRALLRIGEGEDLRPVTAGEIFILTRKDKEGIEISEYLREADVPFAFYKREGLFQTREAEEIRDVLSAVEKPFDQSRRFRAWLTPFFGVPLESLLACKDLPETEQIARKLLDWHFLSNKRRYQELFARILDESGIVRREIFFKEHERELTNYLHIFEILLEEVSSSVCDVSELISSLNGFINGTRNPMREDGNIQRLETDKEAVQIMTMHKSKGLEASVVFIYGGMTAFPKSDLATFHENGKRVLYIGDMPSDIKALSDAEIRDEDQRLMYVAATRAKARLYLPYVAPDQMNSYMNGSYPKMIQRLKDIVSDPHEKLFKIEDAEVHGPAGSENGRGPIKDTLSSWKPSESLLADYDDWERFNTLRERHAGFEVTSYSRIKMRKGGYSVPLENAEYGEEAGGVGYPLNDEEYVGGAEFGAAIHKVFEGIPFEPLRGGVLSFDAWSARGETASLFRDALLGSGINLRHLRYSQRLVFNALTANVVVKDGPMISGLCSVASSLREVEFIYPYPEDSHTRLSDFPSGDFVIERGYVKGFIDFLFEHDGIVYFCDWKTDTLPEYSASVLRKHFEENYVLQTKLYLIALARMLKLHSRQEYDRRFGGVIYCFVRGMVTGGQGSQGIVFTRPSWDELLSYEEELLRSTEYIGGSLE